MLASLQFSYILFLFDESATFKYFRSVNDFIEPFRQGDKYSANITAFSNMALVGMPEF